ncbi:caspase-8-like isoform X2 [Hypanus sabinus]|uniref:caspase-8-like isoform X2 n=1 Tax=Hypanus sabinus TaxID=79690 RepID=UPI0028C38492|nr:caspase-8-like isoform X2 [Hypanus sabinus]
MADGNRHRLMKIAENLGEEEVRDLRFLCSDHIPAGKVVKNALELFEALEQQNLDNIIPELLFRSQQFKLLSSLNMQKAEVEEKIKQPGNCKIQPYRVLLYNISKQIDDKELKGIIYLLNIPKGKCQNIKNFMDICAELEKKENISPDNLTCLLEALVGIKRKDLVKQVKNYQNEARDALPVQESGKQGLQSSVHQLDQDMRGPCLVDAKSVPTGIINHQECQQVSSNVGDPTAESTNFQGTECSSAEQESNSIENLVQGTRALSMEPSQETSTSFSLENVPGSLPCSSSNSTSIEKYKMDSSPLGFCLILNNKNFDGTNYEERKGTDSDAEKLEEVFKWLGFAVHRFNNLTVDEMLERLEEFRKYNHDKMDSFVCCILSHGEKDVVVGTDGKHLQITNMRHLFSGSQCPSLLEKPKIFIIQACQGKKKQKPCFIISSTSDLETDAFPQSIPEDRDFLIAMSTVPNCFSYRTPKGSWFIQTLCECLEEYCVKKLDLLSILTEVNRRVSEIHPNIKQIPEPRFTLSKKLVILPPYRRKNS